MLLLQGENGDPNKRFDSQEYKPKHPSLRIGQSTPNERPLVLPRLGQSGCQVRERLTFDQATADDHFGSAASTAKPSLRRADPPRPRSIKAEYIFIFISTIRESRLTVSILIVTSVALVPDFPC